MSTHPVQDLEGHVVFVDPVPGQRKAMVKASFVTRFRTTAQCKRDILLWARGQYTSSADLHVNLFKPDRKNPHWRADLIRGSVVLARISLTPHRERPALETQGLFE